MLEGTSHLSDGTIIRVGKNRGRGAIGERISIVDRGGRAVVVENAGNRQRIADDKGRTLAETRWTRRGPVAEAAVIPAAGAHSRPGPKGRVGALLRLLDWLYTVAEPAQVAVAAFKAREYQPGRNETVEIDYVGLRSEIEVNLVCPRRREVQGYVDEAARSVERSHFRTPQAYGTAVHKRVEELVNVLRDRNLIAERSFSRKMTPIGTTIQRTMANGARFASTSTKMSATA